MAMVIGAEQSREQVKKRRRCNEGNVTAMSEYSVACKIHRRLPVHVRLCSIRLAPCMLPEATCNNTELSNQVVGQFFISKINIQLLGVGKMPQCCVATLHGNYLRWSLCR